MYSLEPITNEKKKRLLFLIGLEVIVAQQFIPGFGRAGDRAKSGQKYNLYS